MGTRAADNIFQQILLERHDRPLALKEWPKYPPMIGLAVGRKAVVYDPDEGTKCSEGMMRIYFGDDLGFQRKWVSCHSLTGHWLTDAECWDYQKLDEGW